MTPAPLVVSGWSIFAHPLFLDQLEALIAQVEALRDKNPTDYKRKNTTKRLSAIAALAFTIIPQDPERADYRLGNTLGNVYKHWFRAKFFQQYRLFFRYRQDSKIIVYTWVNDETTKHAYESKDDAYRVFRRMLETNELPNDWNALLSESRKNTKRLHKISKKIRE